DPVQQARLRAASDPWSGKWLEALPSASLGTTLDNNSFRVAVGLRLGAALCHPHHCSQCGADVTSSADHGLVCRNSQGRQSRHASINDIAARALRLAGVPCQKEPLGLCSDDGRRPDGLSLIPWAQGKYLVWDATVSATVADSYIADTCRPQEPLL